MSVGAGLPTGPRSVVLAGGGTAGHVEPALALADALRRHDPDVAVTFLGVSTGLEARLVPARGYPLRLIPRVPLPRRPSGDLLTLAGRLAAAVREAAAVVADVSADVVVGFGGYVAMPAYLGARRRHVPFVVHEANLRPGVANRFAARLTPYVAVSFPGVRLPHARLVGLPLRRSISSLDREAGRAAARASFGLDADRPTLLVFGGSQGARRINESVAAAARPLLDGGVQVLHAAGPGNRVEVGRRADDPPYVVVEYLDRMDLAYAAADLALCRSGAMTVAEMTAVGLPAVFVPYPVGNGEQRLNAAPVVAAGGAVMVDDADLTADRVRSEVLPLVTDPPRLAAMARAAASLGRRDADDRLVLLVAEAAVAGRGRR